MPCEFSFRVCLQHFRGSSSRLCCFFWTPKANNKLPNTWQLQKAYPSRFHYEFVIFQLQRVYLFCLYRCWVEVAKLWS